jgi:hypothetical protein
MPCNERNSARGPPRRTGTRIGRVTVGLKLASRGSGAGNAVVVVSTGGAAVVAGAVVVRGVVARGAVVGAGSATGAGSGAGSGAGADEYAIK